LVFDIVGESFNRHYPYPQLIYLIGSTMRSCTKFAEYTQPGSARVQKSLDGTQRAQELPTYALMPFCHFLTTLYQTRIS
jgi:hypothetical protein